MAAVTCNYSIVETVLGMQTEVHALIRQIRCCVIPKDLQDARCTLGRLEDFEPEMYKMFAMNLASGNLIGQAIHDAAVEAHKNLQDYIITKAERSFYECKDTKFAVVQEHLQSECDKMVTSINTALTVAQKLIELKVLPAPAYERLLIEGAEFRKFCSKGKKCANPGCLRNHKCRFGPRCNNIENCGWFHDQTLDFTASRRESAKLLTGPNSSNAVPAALPAPVVAPARILPAAAAIVQLKDNVPLPNGAKQFVPGLNEHKRSN